MAVMATVFAFGISRFFIIARINTRANYHGNYISKNSKGKHKIAFHYNFSGQKGKPNRQANIESASKDTDFGRVLLLPVFFPGGERGRTAGKYERIKTARKRCLQKYLYFFVVRRYWIVV